MTSVAAHPKDSGNILAGAAGGGVWHWSGHGGTWSAASQGLASLNVGALAVDAADPERPVVYCGTGEANLSADGHPGAGLFKSTDWGGSWSVVATPTRNRIPGRIGAVAVDPEDPKRLLIGGVGHRSDEHDASGGLFLSEDGGGTWTLVTDISPEPYWCHSVVFGTDRTIFAAITARGAQSGIWIQDGRGWYHAWDGLPSPEMFHRTSIAVSRSDPQWVYALAADRFGGVLGVFQSRDAGSSWREIGHGHFRNERNMSYNNAIAVHPEEKNHVLCGGVDLHLWNGDSWRQVTSWQAKHARPHLPHADHHCLSMPAGDLVYDMNDGGMAVSSDGGKTWEDRSGGLVTTMFYDLDVAATDATARTMGGGTQDNGTLVTPNGPDDFRAVTGGDGGWMAFDPTRPKETRFFSTVYGVQVYLHHDFPDGWREEVSPPEEQWVRDTVFLSPLQLDPGHAGSVYLGTIGVWRGDPAPEQEVSWLRLADSLDGSAVTALEVAPADPRVVYAGTENGGLFVSRDRGASWSGDLSSRVLPGAMITRIRTLPSDAEELIVSVGRVGHAHVFRSRNWGASWEIVGGKLPNVPFRALAVDPRQSGVVYAGSDSGVFVSEDFGDRWWSFTGSLPNVAVTDLVIHDGTRRLFAATYGRGIWSTDLLAAGGTASLPEAK